MLKEIISITGKPGLYKILSQGRGSLIVESLVDSRRFPVSARDKVVSLGDISMYTESGDTMLGEVLEKTYSKYGGKAVDYKGMDNDALHKAFGGIVEDYDRDRVRPNDIRKLFQWYNILTDAGFESFVEKDDKAEEMEEKEEK